MPFPNINTKLKDQYLHPDSKKTRRMTCLGNCSAPWRAVLRKPGRDGYVDSNQLAPPLPSFSLASFQDQAGGFLVLFAVKEHHPSPEKANPLCLASIVTKFLLFYKYHLTNNHVSYSRHSVCVIIVINSFNIGDYSHQSPVLESISSPKQRGNLDNCC